MKNEVTKCGMESANWVHSSRRSYTMGNTNIGLRTSICQTVARNGEVGKRNTSLHPSHFNAFRFCISSEYTEIIKLLYRKPTLNSPIPYIHLINPYTYLINPLYQPYVPLPSFPRDVLRISVNEAKWLRQTHTSLSNNLFPNKVYNLYKQLF